MDSKKSYDAGTDSTTERKYIIDISGGLPKILCEIDPNDTVSSLKKSYVYTPDGQILYQCFIDQSDPNEYFYIHDRLGSVRLIVDEEGDVVNSYTYDPFGNLFTAETAENAENPFKFTGQWFDSEISQYYLRARMYDPQIMRFTSYDPVEGRFEIPFSLHPYLYCINDPVNNQDPTGEIYVNVANGLKAAASVYSAGLLIACYGAKTDNLTLLVAGGYVMEFSGLAYGLGLGFGDKMIKVTRWGDPGKGPGWVMIGKKNYLNYLLSGKWLGTGSNQFAAYSTGHSWTVVASELSFPSGWKWIFGFVGQAMTGL